MARAGTPSGSVTASQVTGARAAGRGRTGGAGSSATSSRTLAMMPSGSRTSPSRSETLTARAPAALTAHATSARRAWLRQSISDAST